MIKCDDTHTYTVDGQEYPSVTQILKDCGLIDITWYTDETAQRGTFVHECLQLIDQGTPSVLLDYGEDIGGYINAYLQFKKDALYKILQIEKPLYSSEYGFAGTPDRICELNGKYSIIDIKTGQKQDWHRLQLSGYKLLLGESKPLLYGLYLKNTGKYKLEPYKDSEYRNVFYSALTVYNWKHK
jgi:hypothetical protein